MRNFIDGTALCACPNDFSPSTCSHAGANASHHINKVSADLPKTLGADDNGGPNSVHSVEIMTASLRYNYVSYRLEQMAGILGCDILPPFLSDFSSFSGTAEDHNWKSWECSTANRNISDIELQLLDEAEALIEQEGSEFGDRLRALRADRPDLAPLSSGFKIFSWLLMLREERDDSGADACQLYWVIRSGFDILP